MQIGTTGQDGLRTFEVIGRLQRQYGPAELPDAPRNDWFLLWNDDSAGWLSECGGRYFLATSRPAPAAPEVETLKLGQTFHYEGGAGVIVSLGPTRFLGCEGELPFAPPVGDSIAVEIATAASDAAMLDYAHSPPLARVGSWKRFRSLALAGMRNPTPLSVTCLGCHITLTLHTPGLAQTVRCSYCGGQMDLHPNGASTGLVRSGEINNPYRPQIPLGTVAQWEGQPWTAVGAMRRWTRIGGVRHSWDLYLLYSVGLGFRWLSERDGHWTLWEPVNQVPTRQGHPVGRPKTEPVEFRNQEYQHFQRAYSRVEALIGEFPWRIRAGDELRTDEYVCPPDILYAELGFDQISWRCGRYLPARQVWRAFRLPGAPPRARGVGRNQPNPIPRTRYRLVTYLAAVLLATLGLWWWHGGWQVEHTFQGFYPGPPLELRVHLPGSLNDLDLELSSHDLSERSAFILVTLRRAEDASARVGGFNLFSFYARYPDGKAAGDRPQARLVDAATVPMLPRGEYRVRVEVDSQAVPAAVAQEQPPHPAGKFSYQFELRATPRVPYWRLVPLLVLGALPLLRDLWKRRRFERERWKGSDHAG